MNIDIKQLAQKYELSEEAVKEVVQSSISKTLTTIFRIDVGCFLENDNVKIHIFKDYEVIPFPVERLKKNIIRAIKHDMVSALLDEQTLNRYSVVRYWAGSIQGGYVRRISNDRIHVELEGEIVGVCLKEHQTVKERGKYKLGEYYNFYVLRTEAVRDNGVPTINIFLSRTSKGLVEGLLKKELSERFLDVKLTCTKRIAGAYSVVNVSERIPKDCIVNIARELKERIYVVKEK